MSTQHHTMGTSERTELSKFNRSNSPGPGGYSYDKLPKQISPKFKIGNSLRPKIVVSKNPGPGTYELKGQFKKNSGFQFPIANKSEKASQNPGPGTYALHYQPNTPPSFSIGIKTITPEYWIAKFRSKSPGPTNYETNKSTVVNIPTYIIGKGERVNFPVRSVSPGPGRYLDISHKFLPPYYIIGKEQRKTPEQMQKTSTSYLFKIGPGTYDMKSTIQKNIGPSLTPKRKDLFEKALLHVPGPGQYEQKDDILHQSLPSFHFEKNDKRQYEKKKYDIGPGQYDARYEQSMSKSPNIKFGLDQRKDIEINVNIPGPGEYEYPSKLFEGPKYHISPRLKDFKQLGEQSKSPSPNTYNVDLELSKAKQITYKIGKQSRFTAIRSLSPGPGNYATLTKNLYSQGPQFTFGKDQRRIYDNDENLIYQQRQKLEYNLLYRTQQNHFLPKPNINEYKLTQQQFF